MQTVNQDGGRDKLIGLDLFEEAVMSRLVEDDKVVSLILNLLGGPLLLAPEEKGRSQFNVLCYPCLYIIIVYRTL